VSCLPSALAERLVSTVCIKVASFGLSNANADSYRGGVCLQQVVQGSVTGKVVGGLVLVIVFHVLITGGMASVLISVMLRAASIQMQ